MAGWWSRRRTASIDAPVPLAERRQRYAAEILRLAAVDHERVEGTFAAIPREKHLTSPPWTIFAPGGGVMTETVDPADLYQDVLVVLDRSRGINNGQPSLHAAWIAALDPRPGEVAVHIGAGTGYYTAILAGLVRPGGHVHAYEIVQHLAETARRNLGALDDVTVHAASGVATPLPAADILYVNASASAPDAAWLKALKPNGRLVFPWQPSGGEGGVTLQVVRVRGGYQAYATMEVAFIACVGATSDPVSRQRPRVGDIARVRSIWLTEERPPDETAILIYDHVWFSRHEIREEG